MALLIAVAVVMVVLGLNLRSGRNIACLTGNANDVGAFSLIDFCQKFTLGQVVVKDKNDGRLEKWLKQHQAVILDRGDLPPPPPGLDPATLRHVPNDGYRLIGFDAAALRVPLYLQLMAAPLRFSDRHARNTVLATWMLRFSGFEAGLNGVADITPFYFS